MTSSNQKTVREFIKSKKGEWVSVAQIAEKTGLETTQVNSALRGKSMSDVEREQRGHSRSPIFYRFK